MKECCLKEKEAKGRPEEEGEPPLENEIDEKSPRSERFVTAKKTLLISIQYFFRKQNLSPVERKKRKQRSLTELINDIEQLVFVFVIQIKC